MQQSDYRWSLTLLRPAAYGGPVTLPDCDGQGGGWLEPDIGKKRNGVTRLTTSRTTSNRPRSNTTFTWEAQDLLPYREVVEFCQGRCRYEATGIAVDSFGIPIPGISPRPLSGAFGSLDGGEFDIESGDETSTISIECGADE